MNMHIPMSQPASLHNALSATPVSMSRDLDGNIESIMAWAGKSAKADEDMLVQMARLGVVGSYA